MKTIECYTHIFHPGHFRIVAERGHICTIENSHDEREPSKRYAGVKHTDLRTCGCGRWRWPEKNQTPLSNAKSTRR